MSDAPIPVMKPQLATASALQPYLQRIDEARYYSNHGPLVQEFEARLAAHFSVRPEQVMTAANGTTALSAALLAASRPGKRCLLPSWTFVASAAAVWAANLQPHFVDVSADSWMLEPEALRDRTDLDDVAAVMAVSAFGAPVDARAWDAFTEQTGIPVVIDGAAAFDTAASIPAARPGKSLMMISLHATKVFGIGEGAAVLSTDPAFLDRVRQICNFGVWGTGGGQVLGYNGKLSEYHAAVGLATLDGWPQRRAELAELTQRYRELLSASATAGMLPGFGAGWVSCYCNVIAADDAAQLAERMRRAGIETRRWWRSGVHAQPAYARFTRDPLPVTEVLAQTVVGVPFYHDLSEAEVGLVMAAVRLARP